MKKIGIDLDDTLLDFVSAFVQFYNSKHNTSYTRGEMTSFFMESVLGITEEELRHDLNEFYSSTNHKEASPMMGAVDAIGELAKTNELYSHGFTSDD